MAVIKKIVLSVFAILGLLLTFGSEGSYSSSFQLSGEERPSVTLSHTSWDDAIGTTHVMAQVLESEGFDVNLVQLDPSIMFSSLATGDSDATVSPWVPTHQAFMDEYAGQFENLGPHTTNGLSGLVVPSYMEDVNSITDLTDEANKIVTGIEPGAGITVLTDDAMETYPNLSDWTHETSSTGAMLTSLGQAINNQEEIVITGWSPHWMFLQYDLKYLEDPEKVYGDGEDIITLVREGFEEDNPAAYQILDNFSWEVSDMEQVMLYLQEGMSPEKAAGRWIEENPEKVVQWTEEINDE